MNVQKGTNNTGGCLKTCLIAVGALVLITLLLGFGWIAGVVWLLFFRKKLNNEPEKQKKVTILVSVLSVFSFGFMIFSFVTGDSLKSIRITSDAIGSELEINKDYIIQINSTPADADLSDLTFHIDGSCAAFKKSDADDKKAILHTSSAGTVVISVSSGEISSNSLELHIVDTPEEETELTSETELAEEGPEETINGVQIFFSDSVQNDVTGNWRLACVNTTQEIQDYAADYANAYFQADNEVHAVVNFVLNTTNKLTKPSPNLLDVEVFDYVENEELDAKELFTGAILAKYIIDLNTKSIEEIPLTEDQEPTADDSASVSQNTVDTAQPENQTDNSIANAPDNTNAQAETPPETPTPNTDMVWIDDTGKKYHNKSSCSNMDAPYQVSRDEAIARGRDACKKCY